MRYGLALGLLGALAACDSPTPPPLVTPQQVSAASAVVMRGDEGRFVGTLQRRVGIRTGSYFFDSLRVRAQPAYGELEVTMTGEDSRMRVSDLDGNGRIDACAYEGPDGAFTWDYARLDGPASFAAGCNDAYRQVVTALSQEP